MKKGEKMSELKYEVKELNFYRDEKKIAGRLYLPDLPFNPLVIICHGFGGNSVHSRIYAENFAKKGIATYIFDFIGGGEDIESDGKMTEMSYRLIYSL